MTADYAQVVKSGRAWVAEHGDRIVGLLVLEPVEDHLLLENMAVAPQAQGLALLATVGSTGPGSRPDRQPASTCERGPGPPTGHLHIL